MKLENGATLHTCFIQVDAAYPYGLALAETETDWVTWAIYWHGDTQVQGTKQWEHELWNADTGHYFMKGDDSGAARQMAEIDFGDRLALFLSANAYNGLKKRCGD